MDYSSAVAVSKPVSLLEDPVTTPTFDVLKKEGPATAVETVGLALIWELQTM